MTRLARGIGRALSFGRNSESASDDATTRTLRDSSSPDERSAAPSWQPADPVAAAQRYNLATSLLMRGDYARGFELYEYRFDSFLERATPARKFARSLGLDRRWRGESLSNRRIVIWCEQGFGDSLMMFRYLPLLKTRGAKKVMVVCERELVNLTKALAAVDRVLSGNDVLAVNDFDLHCPAMSLPYCFQTTLDTVPRDVPYLNVPDEAVELWRRRLSKREGVKVGLAWAGDESLEADLRRSIPLASLEPLFRVPGVQLVSLQKDRRLEEARLAPALVDWMPECADFMGTGALVAALDLVIAVDTAVAHLAAALGKDVWLLNRFESEWRWGKGATRSVWYPTMTIFNQREVDRWGDVIEEAARRVGNLARLI